MTRLSCAAVRRLLTPYHDGELELYQQVAVQAHLRTCPACAAERRALRDLGEALRQAAAAHAGDDAEVLGRQVLARLQYERQMTWSRRVDRWLDDLHLVWAAVGATAATLICVAAVLGLLRAGAHRQPASMAAVIGAMAHPGSNENPVRLDSRRMLLPRSDPDAPMLPLMLNRDDAVVALWAVVTREGRVTGLELLPQEARLPIAESAMGALLDAAAQARFEPARAGGAPVAVNMVWLLAQTRVVGKVATIGPEPSPPLPGPISLRAPVGTDTRLV